MSRDEGEETRGEAGRREEEDGRKRGMGEEGRRGDEEGGEKTRNEKKGKDGDGIICGGRSSHEPGYITILLLLFTVAGCDHDTSHCRGGVTTGPTV